MSAPDERIRALAEALGKMDLREFVTNGYTPEDWVTMFPPEDEA